MSAEEPIDLCSDEEEIQFIEPVSEQDSLSNHHQQPGQGDRQPIQQWTVEARLSNQPVYQPSVHIRPSSKYLRPEHLGLSNLPVRQMSNQGGLSNQSVHHPPGLARLSNQHVLHPSGPARLSNRHPSPHQTSLRNQQQMPVQRNLSNQRPQQASLSNQRAHQPSEQARPSNQYFHPEQVGLSNHYQRPSHVDLSNQIVQRMINEGDLSNKLHRSALAHIATQARLSNHDPIPPQPGPRNQPVQQNLSNQRPHQFGLSNQPIRQMPDQASLSNHLQMQGQQNTTTPAHQPRRRIRMQPQKRNKNAAETNTNQHPRDPQEYKEKVHQLWNEQKIEGELTSHRKATSANERKFISVAAKQAYENSSLDSPHEIVTIDSDDEEKEDKDDDVIIISEENENQLKEKPAHLSEEHPNMTPSTSGFVAQARILNPESRETPVHVPEAKTSKKRPLDIEFRVEIIGKCRRVDSEATPRFNDVIMNSSTTRVYAAPFEDVPSTPESLELPEDLPELMECSKPPELRTEIQDDVIEKLEDVTEALPPRRRFRITAPILTDDGNSMEIHPSRGTKLPLGTLRQPFHVEIPKNPKTEKIMKLITVVPGKQLPEGVTPTWKEEQKEAEASDEETMEDEEDDDDVELELGKICVGPDFQTTCPDFIEKKPGLDYAERDERLWTPPDSMGKSEDDRFFNDVKHQLWFPIWRQYESQIPLELVLKALLENKYNIPRTLDVIDKYLEFAPQKMKEPTVGQVQQLLKGINTEKMCNRAIQETIMRNYTVAEIYLYRWRLARFYAKDVDRREMFEPRVSDEFIENWEERYKADQAERNKELAVLRKKFKTANENTLIREWERRRYRARRRVLVQYGLDGHVGCNCLEKMCRQITYEPRYGCSRCTNSMRSRKLAPEHLCLVCKTFKELTGQDTPRRAPVFNEEDLEMLQKWIQMEQNLGITLTRLEFERKFQKEKEQRWQRLELTREEILTLNYDKLTIGRLEKQIPAQLQSHILPHFGICQCIKAGFVPSGSKNFMKKFPILLGKEEIFDEKDQKLFCDVITKYPGDIEAASKESGFEMEILEMFLNAFSAKHPIWKTYPKRNYHNVQKLPLVRPALNWPNTSKSK